MGAESSKEFQEENKVKAQRTKAGPAVPESALLSSIVQSSRDAIVSKDLKGTVMSWNPAATAIFGWKPEEIIGRSILTIIPRDLRHEEAQILKRISAGERIEHYETQRVTKSGKRIDVSLTISPICDQSGRVIGASIIARDITDDITDRHRIEDARFRLAAIVDYSDDAIISKNLDGVITSWNGAAERLFGYTAEEMIGRSILTIIPTELQDQEADILARLRRGERLEHFETERLRKSGERISLSLTISPIKDENGRIIGASKIARDITERKVAQMALVQSEKLAATGRMAATIAHEINNPLEAITNLAYLLKIHPSLDPQARGYAELLLAEVSRASQITKQTLAFYRDTSRPIDVDLSELMENILTLNRSKLERKRIEVIKDYRYPAAIFGYAAEIRQVLANLLTNAIDALDDEGGKITIRLRSGDSDARRPVQITVADNGVGIPPQLRRRIFDPFFTTKAGKGTGLGLWVSRGIIEKHGGRVRLRSSSRDACHGTVFSIFLPLQMPEIRNESASAGAIAS